MPVGVHSYHTPGEPSGKIAKRHKNGMCWHRGKFEYAEGRDTRGGPMPDSTDSLECQNSNNTKQEKLKGVWKVATKPNPVS